MSLSHVKNVCIVIFLKQHHQTVVTCWNDVMNLQTVAAVSEHNILIFHLSYWVFTVLFTVTAMSLCGDTLLCNFQKCRMKLSGFAWVTACSHVFCDQHGSGEFSRSPAICPSCSTTLSGKLDIIRTELSPSEDYKAMVLAGLRPDIVLDISARALTFWTYQVNVLLSAVAFSRPSYLHGPLLLLLTLFYHGWHRTPFSTHSSRLARTSTCLFHTLHCSGQLTLSIKNPLQFLKLSH